MNVCSQSASALSERIRLLAVVAVGLFVLAWMAAPSTVLASSATDQYTEPPVPQVPGKPGTPGKEGGAANPGDSNSSDDSSVVTYETGGETISPGDDSGSVDTSGKKKVDSGKKGDKEDARHKKNSKDEKDHDSAAAAALSDSDGGGGNSTLILVVALLIGIPVLVGGGYALYRRFNTPDDQLRDQLRSTVQSAESAPLRNRR